MESAGALIVARVKGDDDTYVVLLVSTQRGCILESSFGLSEEALRALLTENYGEADEVIDERIERAKTHPAV